MAQNQMLQEPKKRPNTHDVGFCAPLSRSVSDMAFFRVFLTSEEAVILNGLDDIKPVLYAWALMGFKFFHLGVILIF